MPPLPSDPTPLSSEGKSADSGTPLLESNAGKAKSFFDYARRPGMPADGACTYWVMGIKAAPNDGEAIREFLAYTAQHRKELGGLKTLERDIRGDEHAAHAFCRALLAVVTSPLDGRLAASAAELAARFRLQDSTKVLAEHALEVLAAGKTSKSDARGAYVSLIGILRPIKAMDLAERAAQAVHALFPQDAELAALKRDVSAERYSISQGLDQPIVQGTFHRNVRDPALQRRLEEETRMSGPVSDIDSRVEAARAKLQANPKDIHAVITLGELLLRRAGAGDEQAALELLQAKAEELSNKGLRSKASDLQVRLMERELRSLEASGPEGQSAAAEKRREILLVRQEELTLRVKEDPDTHKHRHDLGQVLVELGYLTEAIPLLQAAQERPDLSASAGKHLIQAYLGLELYPEVVHAYRGILNAQKLAVSAAQELGLKILNLLVARAEDTGHPARVTAALSALDLASEMLARKFDEGPLLKSRRRVSELVELLKAA